MSQLGKKKKHDEEHADETWLIPYADMLTLLLALFIVMFAMSKIDKQKLQNTSEQFNIIFSGGKGILNSGNNMGDVVLPRSSSSIEQDMMMQVKDQVNSEIKNAGYGDKISVEVNKEGLEIAIQNVVLFKSGDATVLKEVYSLLEEISKMLTSLDNNVKVIGHTDNQPIKNEKFRSNWDLSAIRAINVMDFMVKTGKISPQKISIQAYGEYKPKYDNSTEVGRSKNRRVEILIVRKYPQESKSDNTVNNKTKVTK